MPLDQVLPVSEPLPFWFSLGSHVSGVCLWRLARGAGKRACLGISRTWGQPTLSPYILLLLLLSCFSCV